jgi:CubicO group peptidase (beta-lactamase class C family)
MKLKISVSIAFLMTLGLGCSQQQEQIEETGHIPAIDSLIQQEIEADHIPGAVVQVKKGDSILHRAAYDYAQKYDYNLQPLEDPEKMTTEHLFDLASLTKVCATTFGIMKLVDEGRISVGDPIHNYLPEFSEGAKAEITIRHLLTHTSGLPQWVPTYYHASNRQERYEYIAGLPLKWKVGQERHYSDLGFMLLGDIIERVAGQRFDEYVAENIYQPLNLKHTTFNPLENGFSKIVATSHGNPFEKQMVYDDFGYDVDGDPQSWDGWRQYTLRGEVNDGNAWYANDGVAGHAGLFSTVEDLQKLVDLLIQKGQFRGKQIISSHIIDTFLTKDRYGNGLGWAIEKDIISAKGSPDGTFGHTGFTGTNIVVVPQDSLSIILLTNRQHVGPQENGYYFDLGPLRQKIFNAVEEISK